MGGDSWASRTAAMEGSYFRMEDAVAMRKHLERMVQEGKAPPSSLESMKRSLGLPEVEFRGLKNLPEKFKYQQAEFPTLSRSMVHDWKLGTQVSFGPGRWVTDEASVWDVKAGKELAQTPSKQATWAEEIRARKVAKAQYESPLVAGYRLLPEFTPGRALVWGTILAVWGTMFGTVLASKVTGITTANMTERVAQIGDPIKDTLKGYLEPLKHSLQVTSGGKPREAMETPELFLKLKAMYSR